MPAVTPVERAVATYCSEWQVSNIDRPSIAKVNPETLSSATPPEFSFRYIDISSVNNGVIAWDEVRQMRFSDSPSRARRVLRRGDTMICTVRPLLGSHAYASWIDEIPTICSTGFAVVRCRALLLPEFLKHLAFCEQVTRQLIAWQCGTNYPAVNERDVRQLVIPVPSRDEQYRIACTLDSIDKALNCTHAAVSVAQDLHDSLIHDLLLHGVRHERVKKTEAGLIPASWTCEALGTHIVEGPTNGVYRPENDYAKYGTPIVRIDDFSDGRIHNIGKLRRVRVEPAVQRRYALRADDVLINRVNSLSHIGKAALVKKLLEPTVFESNIMRLRCGPHLRPAFLAIVLCSDIARKHWLCRAKPAVNQASINQRDVRELPLPIPEVDEQEEIVRIVSCANRQIDAFVTLWDTQQELKRSVMNELLTGGIRLVNAAGAIA